jgi:hypothetical protein
MNRRLHVAVATAAAVAVAVAPLAGAATRKPARKGPVPGSTIATLAGAYAHGYPRLTQDVWVAQSCGGTSLGGTDVNNLSASIVPIARYAGDEMTVTLTPDGTMPALATTYSVVFYDKTCQQLDIDDGKNDGGQWLSQVNATKQVGMVPLGAAYVMVQSASNATSFEASPDGTHWHIVVKVPTTADVKPKPKVVTGGVPV